MAARLNRRHQEFVRDKIQASQLINVLQKHALGETDAEGKVLELSASRLKAIDILLKKCVPDLSQVALTGEDGGPVEATHRIELVPMAGGER